VQGVLTDPSTLSGDAGQAVETHSHRASSGPIEIRALPGGQVISLTQSGAASASAYALEGTLKASVTANASTAGHLQNAVATQAFARASWNDGLVIGGGSGRRGQAGTITALLRVDGTLGGSIGPDGQRDQASVDVAARVLGTGLSPVDLLTIDPILRGACGGWALCDRQYSGYGQFGGVFTVSTATFSNFSPTIALTIPIVFGTETPPRLHAGSLRLPERVDRRRRPRYQRRRPRGLRADAALGRNHERLRRGGTAGRGLHGVVDLRLRLSRDGARAGHRGADDRRARSPRSRAPRSWREAVTTEASRSRTERSPRHVTDRC